MNGYRGDIIAAQSDDNLTEMLNEQSGNVLKNTYNARGPRRKVSGKI
jgi:hypothetical protein